jgi:ADP-heptose:LPS heptosyltransferase/tetratricopeptide (TPR) repeat protein
LLPPSVRAVARRVKSALTLTDPLQLSQVRMRGVMGSLSAQADRARDANNFQAAALLYQAALDIHPDDFAIRVQAGHMFKEIGDLDSAEAHYLAAEALSPDDADLQLQLGHFNKIAGRLEAAERHYRRALELTPGDGEAGRELAMLQVQGRTRDADATIDYDRLAPELFPRPAVARRHTRPDGVYMRRLGARRERERTRWGTLRTLRGVEAIHGVCISSQPIVELRIAVGDRLVHLGPLEGFEFETAMPGQRKYVFNIWHDFSAVEPGPYRAEVRLTDATGLVRRYAEHLVVAPPLAEADFPESDAVVDPPIHAPEGLDAAIDARPSMVRPARRELMAPPRNVLVMRTDQLGDMVTSTPAVRRLRELLPQARLVALTTTGNADFTRTLGVFDEVLVADFPDLTDERRRVMDAPTQEALRQRLAPYAFDIAIDLAESGVSRPLLLLSGAKFLYGYYDRDWPFLDGGFEGNNHDRKSYAEIAPQSTKVRGLVERLGASLKSHAEVIRRPELSRDRLARFGIGPQDRFAVLHTGARIVFTRWPYYPELAELLLQRTDLKVIILADDLSYADRLPAPVTGSARFRLVAERLDFDDFDALLSFCDVFVGNDTGPKHLAALRGSPVVSLHSARNNWNEWGQELTGSIISRKVPCASCFIYYDEDECGHGVSCITRITPEEAYAAVKAELDA